MENIDSYFDYERTGELRETEAQIHKQDIWCKFTAEEMEVVRAEYKRLKKRFDPPNGAWQKQFPKGRQLLLAYFGLARRRIKFHGKKFLIMDEHMERYRGSFEVWSADKGCGESVFYRDMTEEEKIQLVHAIMMQGGKIRHEEIRRIFDKGPKKDFSLYSTGPKRARWKDIDTGIRNVPKGVEDHLPAKPEGLDINDDDVPW